MCLVDLGVSVVFEACLWVCSAAMIQFRIFRDQNILVDSTEPNFGPRGSPFMRMESHWSDLQCKITPEVSLVA